MAANTPEFVVYVVIPAYNEGTVVGDVVRRIHARFPNIVVVDDGSTDDTGAAARAAGADVVTHAINRGQGASLQTGIERALARHADVIVTFDSDGQHRLEDVEALIAPIRDGRCDVTLGSRFLLSESRVPVVRNVVLKIGVLFTRVVSGIRVTLRFVEVPVRIVYTDYSKKKGQRSTGAFRIVWDLLVNRGRGEACC
jgi:glycosyltransferase involved in cell wall biosynthesis